MTAPKLPVIWIVDDDEDDQYMFELTFKKLIPPVAVKLLSDGEELLPMLVESATLPSLIMLDLNMPRLNGFETLKQLRAEPAYKDLPVVVLTTSSHREDQYQAEQLGANGFLTKPPSIDALEILFRQLAETWQLNR